ncbi:MAG: restriction endonuclease subunit S [Anaerolineales bacterium]|nr:restriction endonuclease subunit S [Anaerolineales bacterium]MCB9127582.1 restriction endonuclease subunit S [Ardenticatenales bacterium]
MATMRDEDQKMLVEGWANVLVGDLLEANYGKGLRQADRVVEGDIPVYGSGGIVRRHDVPLTSKPSLIIGRKCAAGSVYLSQTPCWPIDTVYFIEFDNEVRLKYCYYLLGYLNLGTLDTSTAIPSLRRDDLYAQQVPLPPSPSSAVSWRPSRSSSRGRRGCRRWSACSAVCNATRSPSSRRRARDA